MDKPQKHYAKVKGAKTQRTMYNSNYTHSRNDKIRQAQWLKSVILVTGKEETGKQAV
jgi:hypothetical protein